jgi:transposase-like protein
MDNSLSREATDWREGRRFRAFELKQEGWSQQRIAEALGVSKGAVSQWMKRARDGGGVEALKCRPAPKVRPRLSEKQRMKLPELLERGAEAHGFRGERSTLPKAPHAPNSRQAVGGLGWFADSSRRGGRRFPCQRGSFSAATRTVARLRSRSQPRRGSVEAPQVRGAKEPLLREPLGVEGRAPQGQGAPQTQERRHPRLHKAARV